MTGGDMQAKRPDSGISRQQFTRGTVLGGHYEVVDCLGESGRATVYLCLDRLWGGRLVAVKVLWVSKRELAADPTLVARFQNEAEICHRVRHPHVVGSYEYFTGECFFAYSMDFVSGGSLADHLENGPIPLKRAVRMLAQACAGVEAIHEQGIIHRDLKPENILLTSSGDVKIADFGIARLADGRKLTVQGSLLGTMDYLAPEYLMEGNLDNRSDVYALGIVGYEMLTGKKPFGESNLVLALRERLTKDPKSPHQLNPECPKSLSDIIMKALSRNPETRYQSAREMLEAILNLSGTRKTVKVSADSQGVPVIRNLTDSGVHQAPPIAAPTKAPKGGTLSFVARVMVAVAMLVCVSYAAALYVVPNLMDGRLF